MIHYQGFILSAWLRILHGHPGIHPFLIQGGYNNVISRPCMRKRFSSWHYRKETLLP
jgi:hypothetical protein